MLSEKEKDAFELKSNLFEYNAPTFKKNKLFHFLQEKLLYLNIISIHMTIPTLQLERTKKKIDE